MKLIPLIGHDGNPVFVNPAFVAAVFVGPVPTEGQTKGANHAGAHTIVFTQAGQSLAVQNPIGAVASMLNEALAEGDTWKDPDRA
jgi:hypothetical protein